MTVRIAIGVGCRSGSKADAIEALIRRAVAHVPDVRWQGVYTIRDKEEEAGLIEAANRLRLDLFFLSRQVLREQAPFVQTSSPRSNSLFGVPSVAEAAALAGAGENATLIVPRIARDGVTCAIAASRTVAA